MSKRTEQLLEGPTRPIFRWAGGKRWLVPLLQPALDRLQTARYVEPFAGGAAVFLGAEIHAKRSTLADTNPDLMQAYETIRRSPEAVWRTASSLENSKDEYYRIRDESPTDDILRAARFVYLNHRSFNGIYRVNLQGSYNVPYGYRRVALPQLAAFEAVARKLRGVTLRCQDFRKTLRTIRADDLAFIDPPYTVAHNANGFVKYNQTLFSFEDQRALASQVRRVGDRGGKYIVTNADHDSIRELYKFAPTVIRVSRRNAVGGSGAVRGSATELLITNIGGISA